MITYILYFISIYVLLYFFGFPFRLLFPIDLQKNDLYITPWIGLSFLSIISIYLNLLGFNIGQFAYIILLCMVILNLVLYYKFRLKFTCDLRQLIFVASTLILSAVYLMFPVYINKLGLSINVINNNDILSYLHAIEYLTNHSLIDLKPLDGFPSYAQIYTTFNNQTRLAVVPISYFSFIFGLEPYKITFLFISFIFYLTCVTFSVFFQRRLVILFISFLIILLNSNYQWLLYNGFVGQLFSTGLLLVIIYLFNLLTKEHTINYKLLIIISILFVFYGQNYPESVPYAALPILSYTIFIVRDKKKMILHLKNLVFIALIILLLDFRIYANVISVSIQLSGNVKAGWDMPIASLPHMLGILNNAYMDNMLPLWIIVISNILIGVLVITYFRLNRSYNSFFAATFCIYFITYVAFINKYDLYKIYKANVSFTYIIIIIVLTVLWQLASKTKFLKYIAYSMLIVLMISNVYSSSKNYISAIYKQNDFGIITKDHEILRNIVDKEDLKNSNYYLNIESWWDDMVAEYFMPKGKTYVTNGAGYSGMVSKKVPSNNDIYVTHGTLPDNVKPNGELLSYNKIYQVYRINDSTIYNYEKIGLGPVQKYYKEIKEGLFVDTFRSFSNNEVKLNFYSAHAQRANVEILLFKINSTTASDIDVRFNRESINKSTLKNAAKLVFNDMNFIEGSNELILQTNNQVGLALGDVIINNAKFASAIPPTVHTDIFKKLSQFKNNIMNIPEINDKLPVDDLKTNIIIKNKNSSSNEFIYLTITNDGTKTWSSYGNYPIKVGVHLYDSEKKLLEWDYGRVSLGDHKLSPSKTLELQYKVDPKNLKKGEYYLQFHAVQDNAIWFPDVTEITAPMTKIVVN